MSLSAQESREEIYLRSPVPLGTEGFELLPVHRRFYLLASLENPAFEGMTVVREHRAGAGSVTRSDGTAVASYPETLEFRLTATALTQEMVGLEYTPVQSTAEMNDFLLGLKFQLKIYRALNMKIVQPSNIHLIGVPSDQVYDERVYRISFETHSVPVDARVVLEVFSPEGERIARFHMELL